MATRTHDALELCREEMQKTIWKNDGKLVFTSGGTEANNLAIHALSEGRDNGIALYSATAHPSQMLPVKQLERNGWKVLPLPVDSAGRVDLNRLDSSLKPDIVALEWVNNEIGFVQPVRELTDCFQRISGDCKIALDASQGLGKTGVAPREGIDALVFSGHKFGAPQGVGGVCFSPRIRCRPMTLGGGQEKGWRSGTVPVPLILAMAEAYELMESRHYPDCSLPDEFFPFLTPRTGDFCPGIVALDASPLDGEVLQHNLTEKGIFIGLGSACRASKKGLSPVHAALGITGEKSRSSIRLSWVPGQDPEELNGALQSIYETWKELKRYF